MEKLTRGDVESSYGLPLTFDQFCKVKKVGVYPMKGVHQIHNKSVDTTKNNSKTCNISVPKRFKIVIKHKVYGT